MILIVRVRLSKRKDSLRNTMLMTYYDLMISLNLLYWQFHDSTLEIIDYISSFQITELFTTALHNILVNLLLISLM